MKAQSRCRKLIKNFKTIFFYISLAFYCLMYFFFTSNFQRNNLLFVDICIHTCVSCSNAFQSIAKASGSNVVIDNDLCDDTDDNIVFHIFHLIHPYLILLNLDSTYALLK